MGIETIGALQRHSPDELARGFGDRLGRSLHDRAHFRDGSAVTPTRAAKSRSVETTFDVDVGELAVIERALDEQARRLASGVRAKGIRGRTVGIKVRLDDFSTTTRARTLAEPTDDPDVIATTALELLAANRPGRPVRLVGVRLASFEEGAGEAGSPEPEPLRLALGA